MPIDRDTARARAYELIDLLLDAAPAQTQAPRVAEVQYAVRLSDSSKPQDLSTNRAETEAYAQRLSERHEVDASVVYRTVSEWTPLTPDTDPASTPAAQGAPGTDYDAMTDEELWDSPLGQRLRRHADKLLAAQEARVEFFSKRKGDYIIMAGVQFARDAVSPDGTLDERVDTDPWATYRSDELEGLREAVKGTDGTPAAAHEAAKAYIASLKAEEA